MTSGPIYFAPSRVPVIDARTGLMSREWYLFFQAMFLRTGGTQAPDQDDLAMSAPLVNSPPDLAALQTAVLDLASQSPPAIPAAAVVEALQAEMQETRDQVAELLKTVQDMRQAAIPI